MVMVDESRTGLVFWEFVFSQNIMVAFFRQLKMSKGETSACRKLVFRKRDQESGHAGCYELFVSPKFIY